MSDTHEAVLPAEVVDYMNINISGIYVDGTLGRGGHTKLFLNKLGDNGKVIGIDRDPEALKKVKKKFGNDPRLKLIHGNYVELPEILKQLTISKVDGMLFDLGVSSPQLDKAERGFSYQQDGPLDMRMNPKQPKSAHTIVNRYSFDEIKEIIQKYGEERWAHRIAKFIVEEREHKTIDRTKELVQVIKNAIPASVRRKGGHPARRTFQALRIATNDELEQLDEMIDRVIPKLKTGGRICIISFHSLEDRIVKRKFRYLNKSCVCPSDFPICNCDKESEVKIITKSPIQASEEEINKNPRSRSAKLRVAEKL